MAKRSYSRPTFQNHSSPLGRLTQQQKASPILNRSPDYFNSFLYTDQVTNYTMSMNHSHLQRGRQPRNGSFPFPQLKNSIELIKETRRFQLKNLQKKNYRNQGYDHMEGALTHQ